MNTDPVQAKNFMTGCLVISGVAAVACVITFGLGYLVGDWVNAEPAPVAAPATPSPIVAELLAEIEAREDELDEMANTLAGAIAERNEAVELLRSLGHAPSL